MFYQLYKDNRSLFRWKLLASNNHIIAISHQGYISKENAIRSIILTQESKGVRIDDLTKQ